MSFRSVAELWRAYEARAATIAQRLTEFQRPRTHEELFYELCFCLLTPGSNGKRCWTCVEELRQRDFFHVDFDPAPLLRAFTRFYRNKARYLVTAKRMFAAIAVMVDRGQQGAVLPERARAWLVEEVQGLGYKEASHFMRNVGVFGNAILDRHVLRNLQLLGMLRRLPAGLTDSRYLVIEEKLKNFCVEIGIPLEHLDLVLWSEETGEVFK